MQTTKSNYASLAFFVVSTLATVALYTFSVYLPENKGTPVQVAMLTSMIAIITCPSLTNVYLNRLYNNYLSVNGVRFYGKIESLEYFKGEAGEFLRGVVLFLYVFMGGRNNCKLLRSNRIFADHCHYLCLLVLFIY